MCPIIFIIWLIFFSRFLQLRKVIFAFYARTQETRDLYFVAEEDNLVFEFQILFWRYSSNVDMFQLLQDIFQVTEIISSISSFCHFYKIFFDLLKCMFARSTFFGSRENYQTQKCLELVVLELICDIGFEFGFTNLRFQKMIYAEF